ncbi:MAG TPA: MarR family transcriptional regulator [Pseudonocardiaceae bacterium]|nr:MarR family transcriptional regulator [Pseudonocardiaceae bacterium]
MAQSAVDVQRALGETLYGLVVVAIRGRSRDISLTSASTMSTLSRTGPLRLTDLAAVEGIAQPSMTSLVTGLERAGLVERRPDPADRRVVLVALTDAGREHLRTRRQHGAERLAALVDQLSEEDRAALAAALPALHRLHELGNPPTREETA